MRGTAGRRTTVSENAKNAVLAPRCLRSVRLHCRNSLSSMASTRSRVTYLRTPECSQACGGQKLGCRVACCRAAGVTDRSIVAAPQLLCPGWVDRTRLHCNKLPGVRLCPLPVPRARQMLPLRAPTGRPPVGCSVHAVADGHVVGGHGCVQHSARQRPTQAKSPARWQAAAAALRVP